ncbi:MAG: RtcB family protein, partial [Halochromatium sp.]
MTIKQVITDGEKPVKVWTEELDPRSREQLVNLSRLPFIHHHVAAMPDVHAGMGATIGSVIATDKAIIPAAVGVDIGCGMAAAR